MTIIKEIGKDKKEVKVTGLKVEEIKTKNEETKTEDIKLKDKVELKPLEVFADDKDALEAYGLTFGIDLSKRKSIENMYADLVAHVESK